MPKQFLGRFLGITTRVVANRRLLIIPTTVALAILVTGGILVACSVSSQRTQEQQPLKTQSQTAKSQTADKKDIAAKNITQNNENSIESAGTEPAQATSASQLPANGNLILSPQSLTIQAGKTSAFTISSDNSAKIEMPFLSNYSSMFLLNNDAGGAKKSWNTTIFVNTQATPGTYNLKIGGQVTASTIYYGNLTVTITPRPSFTVSVDQESYEFYEGQNMIYLNVNIHPTDGFSAPISSIKMSSNPTGINCYKTLSEYYGYTNNGYACSGTNGVTHGTIVVTVTAADQTKTASIGVVMP